MSWSKIETKFRKPLGWWYHKIMCELKYHIYRIRRDLFTMNRKGKRYSVSTPIVIV